mmetsp:Transcript_47463/g.90626  ORF Transcript_47463/g.90626 Transcript_47463/m.90626 type:complete len:326 (-) Transcript_47463:206-1183(-)
MGDFNGNNVNGCNDESEYYKRYGRFEKHTFDGKRGPKIPCKYPERGPMLYEVMEYYADMTRVMNEAHAAARSTVTSQHDEFVYPRETRAPPKAHMPREPSREQVEQMLREQAERQALIAQLDPDGAEGDGAPMANVSQTMSEGQREMAWLKQVTERQMRRMRAGAGYNPDVSTGTKNLWDPEPEAKESNDRYGAVVMDSRPMQPGATTIHGLPAPEPVVCQLELLEDDEPEGTDPSSKPSFLQPDTLSVRELLHKAFPEGNPALSKMESWLMEEGYDSAASMANLEGPGEASSAGKQELLDCGFKDNWIEKIQAELATLRKVASK